MFYKISTLNQNIRLTASFWRGFLRLYFQSTPGSPADQISCRTMKLGSEAGFPNVLLEEFLWKWPNMRRLYVRFQALFLETFWWFYLWSTSPLNFMLLSETGFRDKVFTISWRCLSYGDPGKTVSNPKLKISCKVFGHDFFQTFSWVYPSKTGQPNFMLLNDTFGYEFSKKSRLVLTGQFPPIKMYFSFVPNLVLLGPL